MHVNGSGYFNSQSLCTYHIIALAWKTKQWSNDDAASNRKRSRHHLLLPRLRQSLANVSRQQQDAAPSCRLSCPCQTAIQTRPSHDPSNAFQSVGNHCSRTRRAVHPALKPNGAATVPPKSCWWDLKQRMEERCAGMKEFPLANTRGRV